MYLNACGIFVIFLKMVLLLCQIRIAYIVILHSLHNMSYLIGTHLRLFSMFWHCSFLRYQRSQTDRALWRKDALISFTRQNTTMTLELFVHGLQYKDPRQMS